MRALILLAVGAALTYAPIAHAAAPAARVKADVAPHVLFPNGETVARWIYAYRTKPDTEKLPAAVKAMSQHGLFKDSEASGLYLGFIAGVLSTTPDTAEALVARMFPLPPEDHIAVIKAIAYSGLPRWKQILSSVAERMPARASVVDRYLTGKLPTLADLPLDSGPAPLDLLWGTYYATGSYEPVLRIVSILDWSKRADNVDRLTIGSMAKWTLAQNASRDMDLLQALKRAQTHEPKATAGILKEVIEAADIGEVAKIRKDALASIETMKIKGSEKLQNHNWWGQAGQTALALGCVTASVLGQAAIGIPCVIGGALSGVAIKALAPKE